MYSKRAGTSGIRGQLYETKLISLLYHRACHDDDIEHFYLASNIDNIGAFDDICFKAKVKGDRKKPVAVFVQAKHKENKNYKLEIDLTKYFNSYLDIRNAFSPSSDDIFFEGTFEGTECLFVIYTNAEVGFGDELIETSFSSHLYNLIGTSDDTADQKQGNDISSLQEAVVNHRVTSLAKELAEFISKSVCKNSNDLKNLLRCELVQTYHVLLAQKVFEVSEIKRDEQNEKFRIATFRHDFFKTNDKHLALFKDILLEKILRKRKINSANEVTLLSHFLKQPTDAARLSKLIGTVVTFNENRLEYIVPEKNDSRPPLGRVRVSRSTLEEAIELAAKEMGLFREFKVPTAFGNKDLTMPGNDENVEKRINRLTTKMSGLLKQCDPSIKVTIDTSLEARLLKLNGGLAGAIGNIFVLDDNPEQMKITDNEEALGVLAGKFYKRLITEIPNVREYKFCFESSKFPNLSFSFGMNKQETNLARDFLNKLIFYSKQGNEESVEDIIKREIFDNRDQNDHRCCFQATNDTVYVTYHDEVQKWWKKLDQPSYLTKESNLLQIAINSIIKNPLVSSFNIIYMSQFKNKDYSFSEDAVRSLNLQEQHTSTVIIAENSALTVVKVIQHLGNEDYAVLDLEYIVSLPPNDRKALLAELAKTNADIHIIFICDNIPKTYKEKKIIENFTKAIKGKKTIVITNNNTLEMIKKHFPEAHEVNDKKNSLNDMSEDSQRSVLESATVMFQGNEVKLDSIIDHESMAYVKGNVLNKIMNERIIEIGKSKDNKKYSEIKLLYVDRRLKDNTMSLFLPKHLNITPEMPDDVVLVTAESGMGKSTLLTHLALKTKELEPEVWIVRINLLKYSRQFYKWKEQHTHIDSLETLKFMCQVILREKLGKENNVEIELEEENDAVSLKHCTGDQLTEFELKLFIHYFCNKKMIILFDGFDEISPHYMNEVKKCIMSVNNKSRKHRIWITSRPYSEVINTLEEVFGSSYEIEYFSYMETKRYLKTFWEHNLSIKNLESEQLENVKKFLDYMSSMNNVPKEEPIYDIFKIAAEHLCSEIRAHTSLWPYNDDYSKIGWSYGFELDDVNPLYLYHAAHDVESNIKNKHSKEWFKFVDTYTVYERFLKTKIEDELKKDVSHIYLYGPGIMSIINKVHADSIVMHKKLGAYAIFNQYCLKLFSVKDLEEIGEMLKLMGEGAEKISLIDTVANKVPIFMHMSFAEHFAVEHVCDCFKQENNWVRINSLVQLVFLEMFSNSSFKNIRKIFDHKIKIDETLVRTLLSKKDTIFGIFLYYERRAISVSIQEDLVNLKFLIIKMVEDKLNLTEFVTLFQTFLCFKRQDLTDQRELIVFVLDVVKKVDDTKLPSLLRSQFYFLSYSDISSCSELTAEKIFDLINERFKGRISDPQCSQT